MRFVMTSIFLIRFYDFYGGLILPAMGEWGAMGEVTGVLAVVLSSSIGGLSVGVTRFVVGATDPITLGAFRFGIGSALLLPIAVRQRDRWPNVSALLPDAKAVAGGLGAKAPGARV